MAPTDRLITIGTSHDCEKARWGPDFFGVAYSEERHPPMVHWAWSLPSGGGRTVPILAAGGRFSDGRADLVGGAFSAADLTFAVLTAPVLLPPTYGADLPAVGELPTEVAEIIGGFRGTAAGTYALRISEDCR
jgi:hypothetical protein